MKKALMIIVLLMVAATPLTASGNAVFNDATVVNILHFGEQVEITVEDQSSELIAKCASVYSARICSALEPGDRIYLRADWPKLDADGEPVFIVREIRLLFPDEDAGGGGEECDVDGPPETCILDGR